MTRRAHDALALVLLDHVELDLDDFVDDLEVRASAVLAGLGLKRVLLGDEMLG
jgi:hypothetical protein